ncbi:MAG: hypothetical protein ACRDCG_00350 [Mycoplasmoidaceae bacterium]
MFNLFSKIFGGIIMFFGVLLVSLIGVVGGYLYFAFDKFVHLLTNIFHNATPEAIKEITAIMNSNKEFVQNQLGLGLFIAGVILLGGMIIFGILAAVFKSKQV